MSYAKSLPFITRQDSNSSISNFIQRIFNNYTKAVNKKYKRSGTLLEGKFQSIQIDKENYLIHLCRYIHRNPVEAKLVTKMEDWEYSNSPDWTELEMGSCLIKNLL